jgi:hypothetical protein
MPKVAVYGVSGVLVARAYDTVASIVQAAALKAQMLHNAEIQDVDTDAIAADEMWSFVQKNKNTACPTNSKLEIAG